MAIKDQSVGSVACPGCGAPGPCNFRIEERVTLVAPNDKAPEKRAVSETRRVYCCVKCGHVIS